MGVRFCGVIAVAVGLVALAGGAAGDEAPAPREKKPAALVEGRNGVIVTTSSPVATRAGLATLKDGGTAVDAALATALAQVVECGGSYVSHAGILGLVYYDAATGKVHYLNAGYDTPREEKDPLTIPGKGKPSGRTALVPGFMAGVQAAHDRFGKLPRKRVFAPAVEMADKGIKVNALLGRFLKARKSVLGRLPDTRKIFTRDDGEFYAEGDDFRQPELALTLRKVSDEGAAYMYTGDWAKQFVAAVRKEGGKITAEDLAAYRVVWEEPLRTAHRGHEVCVPGFTAQGGVAMIEALHLLALADLPRHGHFATDAASLYWLMQISHCQLLGFLPDPPPKEFGNLDLTPRSRVKKETAAAIWEQMRENKWILQSKPPGKGGGPSEHSDGVVVVDRWGNVAALTHTINTSLWGDTGLFVGGVSIPDSAAFQQQAIQRAGPGKRLPDPMCPAVVLKGGKPVLGSSAIGGGLHQRTLQVLAGVLDFGMDPQDAVEQPALLLPAFGSVPMNARVERDQFDDKLLDAVRTRGQKVDEVTAAEAGSYRGYWVGVQITPDGSVRRGIGTRKPPLPAVAVGY